MDKKYAVKYCGGCNSRFDRKAACLALERKTGRLFSPEPDIMYDKIFVLCGCPSRCADISNLQTKEFVWISDEAELSDLKDQT